ncbi:MAG: hypothetical protein JSV03_02275, partial [Planctomycetota bacterium]
WKWPWPIQKVDKYDNRIHVAVTTGEETPTRDGKNVIVTTTIGWKIDDPYIFSISCTDKRDGENKLKSRVRNDQKTVISRYDFSNFVSTNPKELKYDQIEAEILDAVADESQKLYGIGVESIGISKLALPSRITQTVFEAMKKERQAVAARYTSEGEARAKEMTDIAEGIAGTIMSFANRKAKEIRAEGIRQATKYLEVFQQDEELAMYLLEIDNLKKMLKDRATIVLDTDHRPTYLLKSSQLPQSKRTVNPSSGAKKNTATTGTPLPEMAKPK